MYEHMVRMPPVRQPRKFAVPYHNDVNQESVSGHCCGEVLNLNPMELRLARKYYLLAKATPQKTNIIAEIQIILIKLGRAAADLEATVEAYYKSLHRKVTI